MNSTAETFVGSITGVLYVTDPKIKIMKLNILQGFFPGLATILVLGEINLPNLCKHKKKSRVLCVPAYLFFFMLRIPDYKH